MSLPACRQWPTAQPAAAWTKASPPPYPCPTCPPCAGRVRKLLSSPAIQFKGTGWYVTDYARKSGSDDAQSSSGEGKSGPDDAGAAKKESKKTDSSKTDSSSESGSKAASVSTPSSAAASD